MAVLKPLLLASVFALFACAQQVEPPSAIAPDYAKALEQWQIIGEGTDFLTVMVPVAPADRAWSLIGSIADESGRSLNHVTALSWRQVETPPGHTWLSFVLYAPATLPSSLRTSHTIQLTFKPNEDSDSKDVSHSINYRKVWGERPAKVYDAPIPPPQIPGVIQLSDYTFKGLADIHAARGPSVSGEIIGENGRWNRFQLLEPKVLNKPNLSIEERGLVVEQGWLELSTGRSYPMQAGLAPTPPYITGWWDGKGAFHPEGEIVR